jgi:chorismate mutase
VNVIAIRGATAVEKDDAEIITDRVRELMDCILKENHLDIDSIITVIFTATSDIKSMFPATAARKMGLDNVALLGAQELDVEGALKGCIRVLVLAQCDLSKDKVRHIYLHEAKSLRNDTT